MCKSLPQLISLAGRMDTQFWQRWEYMLVVPSRILGSLWQNWIQPFSQDLLPKSFWICWLYMYHPSGQVAPGLFAAESPVLCATNTAGCYGMSYCPLQSPYPRISVVSSLASGAECFEVAIPKSGSSVLSPVVISFKTSGCPLALASSSSVPDHGTSGCSFRPSIPRTGFL